jgi:hypothetical protein
MKTIITLMTLSLSLSSFALTCDNEALTVTEQCLNYRYVECYQVNRTLTIKNKELVSYFEQSGMLRSNADGSFKTDYVVQENNGFIAKTTANGLPVVIKMNRAQNGLRLEAFNYEEIPGPHGVRVALSPILADWNFQNCK